jgi:hypothetical protein
MNLGLGCYNPHPQVHLSPLQVVPEAHLYCQPLGLLQQPVGASYLSSTLYGATDAFTSFLDPRITLPFHVFPPL